MKKMYCILVIIILVVLIVAIYFWYISDSSRLIELINNCENDSDCIIVARGVCGGALAINKNYDDFWNSLLEERIKNPMICKPTLPLDFFEASCVNNKCVEKQIEYE